MAEFRSRLDIRELITDERWVLLSPLVFYSDVLAHEIRVPAGFVTDFASVPRVPVAFMLTGNAAHAAAVIHDYLYSSTICTRAQADAVFEEAMAATKQPWWRRKLMWAGVRLFGGAPYNEDQKALEGEG